MVQVDSECRRHMASDELTHLERETLTLFACGRFYTQTAALAVVAIMLTGALIASFHRPYQALQRSPAAAYSHWYKEKTAKEPT